jgi:import inner membrane translocase subunit TIM54
LGEVRKVKVYAGKWPEDDDTDRGSRYFRKYIKVGPKSLYIMLLPNERHTAIIALLAVTARMRLRY